MLVMGHSASTFSTDFRSPPRPPASKKGPRQMLKESVIAEIYAVRYLGHLQIRGHPNAQNSGFTLAAIEKLLGAATVPATDEDNTNNEAGILGGAFKTMLMPNRGKESLLPKFAKSHRLTTSQLLMALESSMTNESFAFNVNYFTLHMRCFRLLRTIVAEMGPVFIKYFGPQYLEKESQLPFVVGYIFRAVSRSSKVGEVYLPKIKSDEGSKMLIQVSQIVARFIKSEGEVEIEKVKEVSQVFLGFELEPEVDFPTLDRDALKTTVQAFNALPRRKVIPASEAPTGLGPNHWHFSLRKVGHRLDPPDCVYLVSPENEMMHVAAPDQGSPILSLPTLSDQADMVVFLLLGAFVKGVLKGNHAHHAKFAPWSWSCNDASLAQTVENKLKEYGVREEMCIVQHGTEAENELCEGVWATLKSHIIRDFTPKK